MQATNPHTLLDSVTASLIASLLYGAAVYFGERFYSRAAKRNPSFRQWRLAVFVLAWILCNGAAFILLSDWWIVLLVTSIVLMVMLYKELNQFWEIGLVGVDREVRVGIDYDTALGMSRHSFHFLGIGAAKLTQNQKAFRDAIDRCNRTAPVRLLLSRPDATELERFARMAGKDKDSYQRTVRESLRFIASLRTTEAKNISVRLYRQFPAFRLMFVDDAICLVSYYIMGKGDGSNLPQLHIIKTPGSQDIDSLYFAFTEYFEKMWRDSEDWDFEEFL